MMNLSPFRPWRYILVYLLLMGLLILTVVSAFVDFGSWNPLINMSIAVAKAVLIMAVFMHLLQGSSNVRVMALGAFVWLALLIGITLTDYQTRPEWSRYREEHADPAAETTDDSIRAVLGTPLVEE